MSNAIIVCGLNGAGKSTLAKALAEKMEYRFVDIEDLYFPKDNPEYIYAHPRSFEEVESILSEIVSKNDKIILASVRGNFKEKIISYERRRMLISNKINIQKTQ